MLFRWWSARLQHLFQELVAHAADGLALGHRKVQQPVRVADVRRDGVPVDITGPLELAHIDVSRADVFLLNVLPGPVDVHAVGGHGGASGRDAAAVALLPGSRAAVFLAAGGLLPC